MHGRRECLGIAQEIWKMGDENEREKGDLLPPSFFVPPFPPLALLISCFSPNVKSVLLSRPSLARARLEAILAISRLPLSLSFLTHPGRSKTPNSCLRFLLDPYPSLQIVRFIP